MTIPPPSHLRLVGQSDPAIAVPWRSVARQQREVVRENRQAATNRSLDPTDPRWVLAVRAYSQLEGSTLTPERRQRVMRTAEQLGLRPFDANVIIAIVQDHARENRPLGDAQPTLQLIAPPTPSTPESFAGRWMWAIILATLANFILIWWLLGG